MKCGAGFAAAVKLAGSLRGDERAAGPSAPALPGMLDLHTEQHGWRKLCPCGNQDTLYGTGQLPKFAGDLFHTRPLEEEADSNTR
ncbi:hypothetical protein MJ585_10065 [Klebsiella pneumoniae]|nr:hypothetical protein MJ585_10065 [Klebsiella pneumoniae]